MSWDEALLRHLRVLERMALTLHTNLGDIKVELFCAEIPILAENFISLAACGTYDGTLFHRNIRGFLVQGGDPTGTGKGGDALIIPPEAKGSAPGKLADVFHPLLRHDARGIVSMANSGPGTNGAQFYITYDAQSSLDNIYSVIGKVIGGWDTLDAMEKVPVIGKKHRPATDITIKSVTIHANPFAVP